MKLLDFSAVVKASCHKYNQQVDAINDRVQEISHINSEGNSETCHQEKQEHMNSASDQILCYVKAFSKCHKVECDAFMLTNKYSFKKRKRSNDSGLQNERTPRPRLDNLADECDFSTFFKSSNSLAGNFSEHLSQTPAEQFYVSDLDNTFTSTCFEQNIPHVTCYIDIPTGEHFDLTSQLNVDNPLNIKGGLEDLQSKNEFKNLMNPQSIVWNCEDQSNYSSNTTIDNQEISEQNQFVQTNEKEQLRTTLSGAAVQVRKELLSTSLNTQESVNQSGKLVHDNEIGIMGEAKLQNTNKEINPRTTTNAAQVAASTNIAPACGTDSQAGENRCENPISFCNLHFKNYIIQTYTFSSESEWDIQLPAQCDILQTITKNQFVDMELLRKTCSCERCRI
ncbi:uncharacterized protein [Mobula birostris]|uniref:uncharacterized protein isoform X1 n=1 Tax=Mobula birostris TaxID=1983395 RepID=UPI003B28D534